MRNYCFLVLACALFLNNLTAQDANENWRKKVNSDVPGLAELYLDRMVVITMAGEIIKTSKELETRYRILKKTWSRVKKVNTISEISVDEVLSYEIGSFTTSGEIYKHLLIWNKQDGLKKRELEIILPSRQTELDGSGIDIARERWMALCNAHNAYELVSILYTREAIYYNHKPVVIGTDAISDEYSYMNRPQYNLKLTPIHVEPVDDNNAFELGQCSGSYGGKYMLWWTRNEQGDWQVRMDSNK